MCVFHALQFRRELLHLRLHLLEGCLGHRAELWSRKWRYDLCLHRQRSRIIKRARDGRIEAIVPSSHHPSGIEWRPAHRAQSTGHVWAKSEQPCCERKLRDELNVTHHGKVWVVSTLHPATAASSAAPKPDVVFRGVVVRRATIMFLPDSLLLQDHPYHHVREDIASTDLPPAHELRVNHHVTVPHLMGLE